MIPLAIAASLGGTVGAVAMAMLRAAKVARTLERFASAFEICLTGRDDVCTRNAVRRFEELKREAALFTTQKLLKSLGAR